MERQTDQERLRKAERLVSQCDRCGACLPVCPLFGVRDVESASARGKNTITRALAQGILPPSREAREAVDFCLLCRTCTDTCPNKIPTDEAMVDVRQYLIDRTGATNAKYRAVGFLLKSRTLVKLAAGALALLRRSGLNRLIPFGMAPDEVTRAHFLATFAGPAALGGPAPPSAAAVTATAKVAYFQGCGMRMMFPAAAADSLALVATTTEPLVRDNRCCGLPHLAHGLREEFLAMARENIALYEDVDVVVSDCASCGGTLKHLAAWFAGDPLWEARAKAFSGKVMDLAEYLVKAGYRPRRRVEAVFTYHDPCHLVRGQGIRREPRELLAAAGTFVEMKNPDLCCAGAGSFHMDYPAISDRILAQKRANIEATGAAVVVTGCPGCLIQMTKAARASGGKFQAMHISQVI